MLNKTKNNKRRVLPYTILIALILSMVLIMINAGRFLVCYEQPRKADVIVILAGDRGERTEYGVLLFKQKMADKIVMSGGKVYNDLTIASIMKKHAESLGVPEEAIISEDESDSTMQNAQFTKSILLEKGYKKAIIVSSNYHMRRVRMVFEKVYKDTGIKLFYCAAKNRDFDENHWWSNSKSIMLTLSEYIKLIGYFLGRGE